MSHVGIMLAVLATTILPWHVHAAETAQTYEGKVTSIGAARLGIVDKAGENKQFDVADDAKITLNGKDARLSDIEVGDVAKVTVKEQLGARKAVIIEARDAE
jgi:hypothetical protein